MKTFTVNYDSHNGYDYDESFDSLRAAYRRYNELTNVPYKSLTFDDRKLGTVTLLNSKGTDNISKYFCLFDYC